MQSPEIVLREVGPRDGFQNESAFVPTPLKLELIGGLIASGLHAIEITSFVNTARVPQFIDAEEVCAALCERANVELWAFAANARGLDRAIAAGLTHVTTALTVSDELNRSNFGKSTVQMVELLPALLDAAAAAGVELDVTIGTAFGDTQGRTVSLNQTLELVREVAALGAVTVTLADTVGIANPRRVRETYRQLLAELPELAFGAHFHDTRGLGVANALAAYEEGVRRFDSSFGGLGGCPFAAGATGNVATEELVFLFEEMGVSTGVTMAALVGPVYRMGDFLGKELPSDVARAMRAEGAAALSAPA